MMTISAKSPKLYTIKGDFAEITEIATNSYEITDFITEIPKSSPEITSKSIFLSEKQVKRKEKKGRSKNK